MYPVSVEYLKFGFWLISVVNEWDDSGSCERTVRSPRTGSDVSLTRILELLENGVYQVVGYYVTKECASCGIL